MPKVSDVMTRGPLVIDGQQLLSEATTRMQHLGVHHLPVIEGARLVGMITETDILSYEKAHPGANPATTMVVEAMSTQVLTVGPSEPVGKVATAMLAQHLDVATVTCDGRIAGIFTANDALRLLAGGGGADSEPEELREWPRRVLCAVDLSANSRAAVPAALRLAGSQGEVTLLHVHDLPVSGMVAGRTAMESTRRHIEMALQSWIRELERPGGARISTAIVPGTAVDGIDRLAREGHFDIIVMGSHGRTGARRLILGSVAEAVARRAPCPVLVVRCPPGHN